MTPRYLLALALALAAWLATPGADATPAVSERDDAPPPVSLRCDALTHPTCDEVTFELGERLSARGRTLGPSSRALPSVSVSASDDEVRIEVRVAGRAAATELVDVSSEVAPAWAIALAAERMLEREESSAERADAPRPPSKRARAAARVHAAPEADDVWFGVAGGVASAFFPELSSPALRAGGIAGFPIARPVLAHARAYVERLGRDPWAAEAFGLAAGPGLALLTRRFVQLAWTAEGFVRLLTVRYELAPSGSDVEGGAGTWLQATFGSGRLRPMVGAGVEVYARRNPTVVDGDTVHTFGASLVSPALFIAVVYHPG